MAQGDFSTDHLDDLEEFEARPDRYVGTVLADRYRVLRLLGEGGMGAVYEAEHTVIGRRVAVKVLHAQFASESKVVKRFVNEARAAAMIGHPNILDCTDLGQAEDGSPFLVLELLTGCDLDEEIQTSGPMQVGRLVDIMLQAASALSAAHKKGIVHRDMKPDNIYLVAGGPRDPHVKVLDFGISKFASHMATSPGTAVGAAMGTPYYMAPEQLRDASAVDARADVYAMGVIMYQALTGRVPYMADSLAGLALQITTGDAPPLGMLRSNLPEGLEEVIATAMERDLDQRYASMDELADALRPYQSITESEIAVRTDLPSGSALLSAGARSHIRTGPGARNKTPAPDVAASGGQRTVMIALGVVAVLALIGAGAAIALSSSESDAPVAAVAPTPVVPAGDLPPAEAAPTEPVAEPAPPVVTTHSLHIESAVSGARAVVRGRVLELPYDAEVEARTEAELIEVNADRHQGLRFLVTMDQPRSLRVNLPRGSGLRDATEAELTAALNGGADEEDASGSSRPRSGGSRPAGSGSDGSNAATPPPAMNADTPPSTMTGGTRVYSGPAGDLPTL
ncbi:MAG: serine/threonine protein kinase [Sandaracinaceae bacterium]|nr:serine/threonine protein kinase [Sandaracinaceae bacterium]